MKITDLDKQILSEAPIGAMDRLGSKIASYVPGSTGEKAKGRLETGDAANKLHTQFSRYLGRTGLDPDASSIEAFLKTSGYPTTRALALIPNGVTDLDKKLVDKMFLTAAQEKRTIQSAPPSSTPPANNAPPANTGGAGTLSTVSAAADALSDTDKRALISYLINKI